jgi:hypothetical protein
MAACSAGSPSQSLRRRVRPSKGAGRRTEPREGGGSRESFGNVSSLRRRHGCAERAPTKRMISRAIEHAGTRRAPRRERPLRPRSSRPGPLRAPPRARLRRDAPAGGWLRQQGPRPEAQDERHVRPAERLAHRHAVEHRQPLHARRMIQRKPVGDASATVVSHDGEPVQPKPLHDRHHVTRHGPFGVGLVVGSRARFAAAPVAA